MIMVILWVILVLMIVNGDDNDNGDSLEVVYDRGTIMLNGNNNYG